MGMILHLLGDTASETCKILVERLSELHVQVSLFDAERAAALGGHEAAAAAAMPLAKRGDVILWAVDAPAPADARAYVLNPNDTPEFAAEKVLDALAAEGVVHLEHSGYTPEEEEQLRERLAKLGYIE